MADLTTRDGGDGAAADSLGDALGETQESLLDELFDAFPDDDAADAGGGPADPDAALPGDAEGDDSDSLPQGLDAGRLLGDHGVGGTGPTAGGVVGAVAQDAGLWARRGGRPRGSWPTRWRVRRSGVRGAAVGVAVVTLLVAAPLAGYWLASSSPGGADDSGGLGAPASLTASATPTGLTVSVLVPNSGPTPTGYTITPTGGSPVPCTMTGAPSGPAATCALTGLASGTSYSLAVRSVRGSDVSRTSTSLTTSTASAPAPARPRPRRRTAAGARPSTRRSRRAPTS